MELVFLIFDGLAVYRYATEGFLSGFLCIVSVCLGESILTTRLTFISTTGKNGSTGFLGVL